MQKSCRNLDRIMTFILCMMFNLIMSVPVAANDLVSLDVHDAPMGDVLRMLAMQSNANLVTDSALSGVRVTVHLERVGFTQAINALSQAYGLQIRSEHGIMVVSTQAEQNRSASKDDEKNTVVVALPLRYIRADDALRHLNTLLPDKCFTADSAQNAIMFIGSQRLFLKAKALLHALDVKNSQVRCEIQVVDVDLNQTKNVGALFGGPDGTIGSTVTTFESPAIQISATLQAMISNGHARLLARPRLVTTNNTEATLLIGESYPVVTLTNTGNSSSQQVNYVDIGVKVKITPTIGADGSILAELHPEYSQVQGLTSQGMPIVANRHVDATLRVRNNESIVLAGLLQDVDTDTVTKVPLLGDLPILGSVFKNRQHFHTHDEIVFIITPHVI